jgi:hypothetical protein
MLAKTRFEVEKTKRLLGQLKPKGGKGIRIDRTTRGFVVSATAQTGTGTGDKDTVARWA